MNRRNFLALLGAAPAIAASYKLEHLIWADHAPVPVLADLPEEATALHQVASEVLALLEGRLADWPATYHAVAGGARVGDVIEDVPLKRIYGVAVDINRLESLPRLRGELDSMAAMFEQQIRSNGSDVFANVVLPKGVDETLTVTSRRLAIRATRCYYIRTAEMLVRLDILAGQTPTMARQMERWRQRDLAAAIRTRLARPRSVMRLPA